MSTTKPVKKSPATARFDARLSRSQKALFEKAAKLKGYKSLSEFVIQVTQEAAMAIVEKHDAIIASEKDRKIFFDALIHPPKPNKAMLQAARAYQKKVTQA
jgi:uncharacterized protein (DUF1778 family)